MDEQKKYEVIKALADHPNGNKDRAALTLGCTKRHINRMLAGYRPSLSMATGAASLPLRYRKKPAIRL